MQRSVVVFAKCSVVQWQQAACKSTILTAREKEKENTVQKKPLLLIFFFNTVRKVDSAKTALPTLAKMQRRMSVTIREYKFFRSFSQKFENWPKRKAEALWRKMRERKIAGENRMKRIEAKKFCWTGTFPLRKGEYY